MNCQNKQNETKQNSWAHLEEIPEIWAPGYPHQSCSVCRYVGTFQPGHRSRLLAAPVRPSGGVPAFGLRAPASHATAGHERSLSNLLGGEDAGAPTAAVVDWEACDDDENDDDDDDDDDCDARPLISRWTWVIDEGGGSLFSLRRGIIMGYFRHCVRVIPGSPWTRDHLE